jgi:signal transduction histidine kinase
LVLEFGSWMFVNLMVALGLVFLAAYPPVLRQLPGPRGGFWRDTLAGAVMAVFCMLYPWKVGLGQQLDLRMVPLGLVGWTAGWPAAAVIGLVIIAVRADMGGPGVITTVFYTLLCVGLVPLFRHRPRNVKTLAVLGVAQTVAGYVVGQALVRPAPKGLEPTSPFWLVLAAVQILGLWLVNGAMEHVRERQRLQGTLADALRSKEAVLELIPHGILIMDAERQVIETNEAARTLLCDGGALKQILSCPDVSTALRGQRRISTCRVTLRREGAERIVLVSAVPLEGGGAVLGIENVTTVIHEEREEARRDRLELLGRMAAMAAHEIRNPLTTIHGFVQLLAGRPEFAGHRSTFTLVQGEVEHINRVVGDFLELSGGQHSAPVPVSVDVSLAEVLAGMALQFPDSQVTVVYEGIAGLTVLADARSLKQVLRNLVVNAFEAMSSRGRLILRRGATGGTAVIDVSDTGPGIAREILAHIFTPYMTTKSTGTGLGLAISHKLASDMAGRLSVVAQPGDQQGTTFRLELPLAGALTKAAAAQMPDGRDKFPDIGIDTPPGRA